MGYIINDMEWQRDACGMCSTTQRKISVAQYIGMVWEEFIYMMLQSWPYAYLQVTGSHDAD
jgi:hypothetical protein